MNKFVREHYPAARLPAELREGLDPRASVTITIEQEDEIRPERVMTIEQIYTSRMPPFRTKGEIDEALRRDREEWDR